MYTGLIPAGTVYAKETAKVMLISGGTQTPVFYDTGSGRRSADGDTIALAGGNLHGKCCAYPGRYPLRVRKRGSGADGGRSLTDRLRMDRGRPSEGSYLIPTASMRIRGEASRTLAI